MTSNEKLDNVLEFLLENRDVDGFTLDDAFIRLKDFYPKWTDLPEDLDAILRKLEKEGLVLISFDNTGNQGNRHKYYRISFDGKHLIENGGYSGRFNKENDLLNRQRRDTLFLKRLQIIIALGTSIAAIYYLSELCWKYHWLPFCCP